MNPRSFLPHILVALIFLGGAFIYVGGIPTASAVSPTTDTGYSYLAPLPKVGGASGETVGASMASYLSNMLKLIVALGGVLAVFVGVVGGIQYVASGITPSAKNDAKNRIQNALTGLVLVLSSYLILNSINPNLVNISFELKNVATTSATVLTTGAVVIGTSSGSAWPDDSDVRNELLSKGIGVTSSAGDVQCTVVGQGIAVGSTGPGGVTGAGGTGCTSVYGLPRQSIDALISLSSACKAYNMYCVVTVTGGTEYWLHETHGAANSFSNIVDLSASNTYLNEFIVSRDPDQVPTTTGASCGVSTAPHYYAIGESGDFYAGTYVRESSPDHWHVCF